MTNILETIKSVALTPEQEKKPPLHVGEVMNLWIYLTGLEEINRFVEISLNTTNDKELVEMLHNSFNDCSKHIKEVTDLFKKEGVPIPPTTEEKPKSDRFDVPEGVRMNDEEIANMLIVKQVAATMMCATGLTQSVRTDIGGMWIKFFMKRAEFSGYIKPIMQKRGWLKIPPYYNPPGRPQ